MTTFKEFMVMVDSEMKQGETYSRANVPDSYRIARATEVKSWINQAIGPLMTLNPVFWERTIEYTPLESSDYIEIPYHIRLLRKIYSGGGWHNIGIATDPQAMFQWMGGRKIKAKDGFSAGELIYLDGTLRRDIVIDDESEIDFPEEHIRLLLLKTLLMASSRDNHQKSLWYSDSKDLEFKFKNDIALVQALSKTEPTVGFGV